MDLLEKYLYHGKNLTNQQKERWSGDYPYTVLVEALSKIFSRLGCKSIADLAKQYPKINHRNDIEDMLRDIGLEVFGFKQIRSQLNDFAKEYNIPPELPKPDSNVKQSDDSNSQSSSNTDNTKTSATSSNSEDSSHDQKNSSGNKQSSSSSQSANQNSTKSKAYAIHDQRTVTQTLKKFNPKGNDRQKLVTLRDELKKLKVKSNPIAFCFILRSMFEISANIYAKENSIPIAKTKNGKTIHFTLQQQLSAVTKHLTSNNTNKGMVKILHGANSELAKPSGLLSVTSMNQLVHNPSFSIAPHDIFTLFNNVYPLLEAMN